MKEGMNLVLGIQRKQRDGLSTRRAGKGRPRPDKEQFVRSARNTGNIINSEQSY